MLPPLISQQVTGTEGPRVVGQGVAGHLMSLSVTTKRPFCLSLSPAQPSQKDAYLACAEVEEDSSGHLDDEHEEEEGKVLEHRAAWSQLHGPLQVPPPHSWPRVA